MHRETKTTKLKIMQITLIQHLILMYWVLFEQQKYNRFNHYINIGVLPKYAIEKTKEDYEGTK